MSEETTDTSGDDFDPSGLSEEVAEEAHEEERKGTAPERDRADADDDDTEERREKRHAKREEARRPEKREAKPKDEDEGEPKKKPTPKKEEAPRVYKAKVRGKETDVPAEHVEALAALFDMDPADLLRGPQVFKAGQEKLRTAAELEKKAKALEERLKKEPNAALREVLGDEGLLKLAIEHINAQMETERLQKENPAELERRKIQAELDRVKAEKQAALEEREAEEQAVYQAKAEEKLGQEIRSVLDSGKLPKDPYVVKRLASHMLDHLEKGGDAEDLSAADFVPLVLEEMNAEHSAFLGKLSGEDIIARFPETAEKVRKAYAARVGRRDPPARQPDADPAEREERPRPRVRLSTSDVLRNFRLGR